MYLLTKLNHFVIKIDSNSIGICTVTLRFPNSISCHWKSGKQTELSMDTETVDI